MDPDTPEILILRQFRKTVLSTEVLADLREVFRKASKRVSVSTIVVSPNPFSPIPAMPPVTKTEDLESPGPSASLVKAEETQENTGDPDTPQPAAEGDIQMEYPSD
jgi:hypothetical protein